MQRRRLEQIEANYGRRMGRALYGRGEKVDWPRASHVLIKRSQTRTTCFCNEFTTRVRKRTSCRRSRAPKTPPPNVRWSPAKIWTNFIVRVFAIFLRIFARLENDATWRKRCVSTDVTVHNRCLRENSDCVCTRIRLDSLSWNFKKSKLIAMRVLVFMCRESAMRLVCKYE